LKIQGQDQRALCYDGDQIEIGFDNQAWIYNSSGDDTFKAQYFGGIMTFDVNVSDIGCNCATTVSLVTADDDKCPQGEYDISSSPQCP